MLNPEENIELKNHTTFKIGGPARYFFRVKNVEEAREALGFARKEKLSFFVLGGGSNLLASDSGFAGVVIKNEILGVSLADIGDEVEVVAGAGENWDKFVAETVKRNLYGLENLSAIPGTVGATPVQNIGAYGVEVKESIYSAEALNTETGELKTFSNQDCRFAYRDSFFKTPAGKKFLIISVCFRLRKEGKLNLEYKDLKNHFSKSSITPTLESVRQAVIEIRKGKFPDLKVTGTAGSFFKNPIISRTKFDELKKEFPNLPGYDTENGMVKVSLAWILDGVLHCKGMKSGAVGLHHAQPLVLINNGSANADEVSNLAVDLAGKVKDATGIVIEWEVEKM